MFSPLAKRSAKPAFDSRDSQLEAIVGKTGGCLPDNLCTREAREGSTDRVAALIFTKGINHMTNTATEIQPQTSSNITTWNIDPAHSVAEFKVKHMMIANVKATSPGFREC